MDKYRRKSKGHRCYLGAEFIQFLAVLAILPWTIFKNRMNSSFYFKSSQCNSSYYSNRPVQDGLRGKEFNKNCAPPPQTEVTTFAFSSVFILFLWYCPILLQVENAVQVLIDNGIDTSKFRDTLQDESCTYEFED